MDIGGINANYAEYLSGSASAASKTDQLNKMNPENATDEEMMNACKQFEEYFVEMVLKEVFKTVDLVGSSESSTGAMSTSKDWIKDGMVQKFATMITEESNLGLAQQLYDSMKRNTISVSELPDAE